HDDVALADAHRRALAVLQAGPRSDGDHRPLDGALLGGLGQVNPRGGHAFGLNGLDENAIFKWLDGHRSVLLVSALVCRPSAFARPASMLRFKSDSTARETLL